MKTFSRYQVATATAILFHVIGLAGILFINKDLFVKATFINLLLMFFLLIYTQKKINGHFILFIGTCIIAGIGAEIIGTSTGWLFGDYRYGNVLGPQLRNVPVIIGINWFIIIYCSGICIQTIITKLINELSLQTGAPKRAIKMASIIVDGATLALLFDWIMEPVAVKLGFWTWIQNPGIPMYNYFCWFALSALLMAVFHFSRFDKQNKFAVNLLLIQMMFFLLLRTLL